MSEEKFNKNGSPRKRNKDGSYRTNCWDDPNYRERCSKRKEQDSQAAKERWQNPEYRANQEAKREEANQKRSKTMKQRWEDLEYQERQGKALKKARETSEYKANHKTAMGLPETRKKLREASIENWKDPDYRSRSCESQRQFQLIRWSDPEKRKKQSERSKETWADPVIRIRRHDGLKKCNIDPIKRKKQSMSIKKTWADPEKHKSWKAACARGERNSLYIDGSCADGRRYLYGSDFTETLRKSIRKRDGFKCVLCSHIQGSGGRKLSVHHINSDKFDNREQNLVSLCSSCHKKVHIPKNISFFEKILSDMMLIDEHFDKNFVLIA